MPDQNSQKLPPNFLLFPAATLLFVTLLFGVKAALTPGVSSTASHHKSGHGHYQESHHSLKDNHGRQEQVKHAKSHKKTAADLPVMAQIPDFSFTERTGNSVASSELKAKAWVVDFIFTSCKDECPLMNLEMQKVQKAFSDGDIKMLSFSVDPENDTPERLRTYADQFEAGPHWLFFTGEREKLHQFAMKDFKLSVQERAPKKESHHDAHGEHGDHGEHKHVSESGTSPFLHSQKFVLVDAKHRIRGYYDSRDPAEIQQLIEVDLPALLAVDS